MRILLIEDDYGKEAMVRALIRSAFPEYSVEVRRSIMAGKVELRRTKYDCMLLDMTLPLFDSDDSRSSGIGNYRIDPFGGKVILGEADRLGLSCKVIVITAYDVIGEGENRRDLASLTDELKGDYPNLIESSIYYDASSNEWRKLLKSTLRKLGAEHEDLDC